MRLVEFAATVTACIALGGCAAPALHHVESVGSAGDGLDCRIRCFPSWRPRPTPTPPPGWP